MNKRATSLLCMLIILPLALTSCSASSEVVLGEIVEEAQAQIPDLEESFGNLMDISISARESSIVYTYQYKGEIEDLNVLRDSLDSTMDSQAAVFEEAAANMRRRGVKKATLILEFVTPGGDVFLSKEYS